MEKRLLLAIALTFLVTVFWMQFCVPRPDLAPRQQEEPLDEDASRAAEKREPVEERPEPEPEPGLEQPAPAPEVEPRIWEIETPTHALLLSNQGGGSLRTARLKTYFDQPGLTEEQKERLEHWLPLIVSAESHPGSLVLRDLNQDYGLDRRYWQWEEPRTVEDGSTRYVFRTTIEDDLEIVKTIIVPAGAAPGEIPDYHLRCSVRMTNVSYEGSRIRWNLLLTGASGLYEETDDPFSATRAQTISRLPGRQDWEAEEYGLPIEEDLRPAGEGLIGTAVVNKYFTGALLTEESEGGVSVFIEPYDRDQVSQRTILLDPEDRAAIAHPRAIANVTTSLRFSFELPDIGVSKEASFLLYLGPKDPEVLKGRAEYRPIYSVMEEDYGSIFGFMTKGLIALLHGFEAIVGNFGFAIILLTLLVRMILFPLNRKQQVTMQEYQKKMVVLKPKLEELREKHKNNRQKFSQEQMKLLKEHQATPPLAGCLPIFLQLPIFIGLFTALRVDIDLRHSPFILWIQDLSQPDRLIEGLNLNLLLFNLENLNLLPILMTVTWIVNQSMMPKAEDPQQRATQKMMMIMPVIFAFMLYRYASGLSLYMFTSSMLGIFEQRVVKKTLDARKEKQLVAQVVPAESRRSPSPRRGSR